jgi:hypothetical protein
MCVSFGRHRKNITHLLEQERLSSRGDQWQRGLYTPPVLMFNVETVFVYPFWLSRETGIVFLSISRLILEMDVQCVFWGTEINFLKYCFTEKESKEEKRVCKEGEKKN